MAINVTSSTVDNVAMIMLCSSSADGWVAKQANIWLHTMDKPKALTSIKGAARMCTQLAQLATDPHSARNALFVMALTAILCNRRSVLGSYANPRKSILQRMLCSSAQWSPALAMLNEMLYSSHPVLSVCMLMLCSSAQWSSSTWRFEECESYHLSDEVPDFT